MLKKIFTIFHFFSLIVLTSAAATAQGEQSSRLSERSEQMARSADHHQHLFSPAYVELQNSDLKTITAQDVIALLDKVNIRRAVLLSTAYAYGKPGAEPVNEYEKVKAENDWTAAQAAPFPETVDRVLRLQSAQRIRAR